MWVHGSAGGGRGWITDFVMGTEAKDLPQGVIFCKEESSAIMKRS